MARDADGIIKQKYAESGDVGLAGLDLEELWPVAYSTPGGPFPQRIQFNQLFRYLSALAVEINTSGPFLDWDGTDPDGPDYGVGAIVKGSDSELYECFIANGPDSSIVDPVGDVTGTWKLFELGGIGLPSKAISGLVPSNAADTDHDITLSSGKALDSTDGALLSLTSAITKQIDAAWVAGSNNGGLFSGSVAANTTYYMFIIEKDSDGSIDAGWDTDINAANIPAGYTKYRLVDALLTDSSGNIVEWEATEVAGNVRKDLKVEALEFSGVSIASRQLLTLSVPTGLKLIARVGANVFSGGTSAGIWIRPTSFTDVAPLPLISNTDINVGVQANSADSISKDIVVDTNGQIAWRASSTAVSMRIFMENYLLIRN